jgi:HAMP domain-containing protein
VRVSITVKIMASYVAVIAAGAVPLHWSLQRTLEKTERDTLRGQLTKRVPLYVARLAGLPTEQAVAAARDMAPALPERMALLRGDGVVLFDSQAGALPALPGDTAAPEVQVALGGSVGWNVREWGGVAVVHVAALVPGPTGAVLRLQAPVTSDTAAEDDARDMLRRGEAVALFAALLLGLAAVAWLVRPLRRMREAALALARGELTVAVEVHTQDELDDLARSLETVGAQLRARLVAAGSGEALLGQLTHAVVQGVLVMGPDGRVHHLNGPARALLGLRGPAESERLQQLLASPVVREALEASGSDPHGVEVRVPHPVTGAEVKGTVLALRRPDAEPLQALILDVQETPGDGLAEVPDERGVVVVPLRQVMDAALRRVREDLEDSSATFATPDDWPAVTLADAGGVVEGVVTDLLREAARSPGAQARMALTATAAETRVGVRLAVALAEERARKLAPRLAPLGGDVEWGPGAVQLWLPRA